MSNVENAELGLLPEEETRRVSRGSSAKPARSFEDARAVLEVLLVPILIVDGRKKIAFINAAARKLLVNGLDLRIQTHLRSRADKAALSLVRFELAGGHDLFLRIQLTDINWMGQRATQVSLFDVTTYLAAVKQAHRELVAQLRAQQVADRSAAIVPPVPSDQTEAPGAEVIRNLQTQLNRQSGLLAEAEKGTEGLRQELRHASEDNAQLRTDIAALVRAREELKKSHQRLQEQIETMLAAQASEEHVHVADEQRAAEERIRALDDALAQAKADRETESRKARQAHELREAEQSQLLAKVSELMSVREELEKKAAALADEAAAAREQTAAAVHERGAQAQECARLSAGLRDQTNELEAQAAELAGLQELTRRQAEESAKSRESVARQMEVAEENQLRLTQETEHLRAELAGVMGQKDELAREFEKLRLAGAEAGRQLEEASARRQALEKEREALQQNVAHLEQARAEVERARHAHEPEAREVLRAEQTRASRLAEEVKTLRAELAVARTRQGEADREADALRLALTETRKALEEGAAQAQALESERATLQQEIESLKRSWAASEKARESLEQEARARADALAREQDAVKALSAKREAAERERNRAELRAQEEAVLRTQVEERNTALSAQLQTAQCAAKEQLALIAEMRRQTELLSQEVKNARSELTRHAEAAQKRQDTWARERADLESRARWVATSLEDTTAQLAISNAARQCAERNAAEAAGGLAEQVKAADSAQAAAQRFEQQAIEQAETLAQVSAALNIEASGRTEAQKKAERLARELEEARCEMAHRAERVRESQNAWADERSNLEACARQATNAFNDATNELKKSEVARQYAEGAVAAAQERLVDQERAATAAEAELRRLEEEAKRQAEALAQANAARNSESARRASVEEGSARLMEELAQTRNDLAHRTKVEQKRQEEWAQERRNLEAHARQLTQALKDATENLGQTNAALTAEANGRAEAQNRAEKLGQDLAEARSERVRQTERVRESQGAWDEERAKLEARSQQAIKAFNDATNELKKSEVARQHAEGEVAAAQERLVEHERAATSAEAELRRLEEEAKRQAEALAQANAARNSESARRASVEEGSARLMEELAQTRNDLAHRTKVAQKRQDVWAQERRNMEAHARQLTQALNDATENLAQSEVARQHAEGQAAAANERLVEQAHAAAAAETDLRRLEEASKGRADALALANAALNSEAAKHAQDEEARAAMGRELTAVRQSEECARATLAQVQERVASLERQEAETRFKNQSRLEEDALAMNDARSESVGLQRQLLELTAALEEADQTTRRQSAARERAEQECERLQAEIRDAEERSAEERKSAQPFGVESDARHATLTADGAESDRADIEEQLAERTRELAGVRQQLQSTIIQVLLEQATCQSRAQEVLDLQHLMSGLKNKYAALEKHIKSRTREQARLIVLCDQAIARRRDAEAENERFRREMAPACGDSLVEAVAPDPAQQSATEPNADAKAQREFRQGNQPVPDAAAETVAALQVVDKV